MSERRPYVIVTHTPSGRGFCLDRSYALIGELTCPAATAAQYALLGNWMGWRPSGAWQQPDWAFPLPDAEFSAVWVEERTPLVSADAVARAALAGWENADA